MIGIIGALPYEVNTLIENLEHKEEKEIGALNFYQGIIHSKDVVVVKSKVGKVNAAIATTILALIYKCDIIISTGIAGGVKPLKTKDVVLINKFIYGDVDASLFGYSFGQVPDEEPYFLTNPKALELACRKLNLNYHLGTALTQDKFITQMKDVKIKDQIIVTEMESTAIAHVCDHFKIACYAIRFVSDVIQSNSQINNYNKFEEEASILSASLTMNIINYL